MVFTSIKKVLVMAALAVAAVSADASLDSTFYNEAGILQIGTNEALNITAPVGTSRDDQISYDGASYVAVHFSNFNLPDGDVVIVRDPESTVGYVYTGKGRDERSDFISTFIPGDTAIVQYFSLTETASTEPAYEISGYSRGFPNKENESVCGTDNTVPAKCFTSGSTYYSVLPQAYEKARSVARLLIGGTSLCTGWLIGSEGHLITNQHCVTQASEAAAIDVEFMAESSSCSVQCKTQLGCAGTVAATTTTFITNDEEFDFALLKLPAGTSLSAYKYLQLRASGPVLNEQIYIPQHPSGYAKRVSHVVDSGAKASITSVHATLSCGTNEVGYLADTAGGASGSPVIAAKDNAVVALHHCGGCENSAVDVRDIIANLKSKSISVANLTV